MQCSLGCRGHWGCRGRPAALILIKLGAIMLGIIKLRVIKLGVV